MIQMHAAPRHLSPDAAAWWNEVVKTYELEPQHLKLLQLACEAWDRAQEARRTLGAAGSIITGRYGQPVAHPAVRIEREARHDFARLLRQLDLDGDPDPSKVRA